MENLKEIFIVNRFGILEIFNIEDLGFKKEEFEDLELEILSLELEDYFKENNKILEYVYFDGVGRVRFESKYSNEEILNDIEEFYNNY
jgi:hypothetical protein